MGQITQSSDKAAQVSLTRLSSEFLLLASIVGPIHQLAFPLSPLLHT